MTELSTSLRYFCTSGRCTAAWVRSDDGPVAATRVPIVAARPEVETFGLVLPRVNLPHSGWPLDAQPCASVANASTSDQPIGASGQPSAFAIGSGMASTNGVEVTPDDVAGTMFGRSLAVRSLRSRLSQVEAAGVQTSGAGPFSVSSQPAARFASAVPEAAEVTAMSKHLPSTVRPDSR